MHMIDLAGKQFARWTVIRRADNTPKGQAQWLCRCECGAERALKSIVIRRGISQSCGCLRQEVTISRSTRHGHSEVGKISPTYGSWGAMISRCRNPKNKRYDRYGGRGIRVCDRWSDFRNFLADMGERPEGLTLERRDTDGNYEPSNCYWASSTAQARNKSTSRFVEIDGIRRTVAEWSEVSGIPFKTLSDRHYRGKVGDGFLKPVAVTLPSRQRQP